MTARDARFDGSDRADSTSRSLIARARGGDAAAWDRLVGFYAPLVHHWCAESRLQPADIADLVQETFQAAAKGIDGFRKERPGDTFRGWLRTIAANKVRDRHRQRQREPRAHGGSEMARWLAQQPGPDVETAPPAKNDEAAFAQVLTTALAHIRGGFRDNTWQAFWRTTIDGRGPADVGSELGMSAGAVRIAKSRVLQRLRAELGDGADGSTTP